MSKTTELDFALFKQSVIKWQKRLGLTHWQLYFDQKKDKERYAGCAWSMSDSIATLTLSTTWDDIREKSKEEINKLALHEMLHLLMAEMVSQSIARYTTEDALDIAEHAIIRRLENVLLGD